VNKSAEEGLKDAFDSLSTYEAIDPQYFPEQLADLRHYVFFVHSRIEASIDTLYQAHVFNWSTDDVQNIEKRALELYKIKPVIEKLNFLTRVEAYRKAGAIDGTLKGYCKDINTYRNQFAHYKQGLNFWHELAHSPEIQLKIAVKLLKAMQYLNEFVSKKLFSSQKEMY
jgi:hypothetical protein